MIRESKYFHFAGRKSTDFDIVNVNISTGLYNEQITSNRSINEVYIAGREDPYFIDVVDEPQTIQLRFAFTRTWDDKLIDEVIRWLNVKTYQPLYFSADIDKVYYVLPVDGIQKIHNGLKQGYLTLNMRCKTSRSVSHEIVTPEYNTKILSEIQNTNEPIIKIGNKGHVSIFPVIWIEKIDDGNILIYNKTNNNELFKFENIEVGEKLFIDCTNELINTDKENTYRYDDFNGNYLEIVYGENVLSVSDNMKIRFKYRYQFS